MKDGILFNIINFYYRVEEGMINDDDIILIDEYGVLLVIIV